MEPTKVWVGCSVCAAKVVCTRYGLLKRTYGSGKNGDTTRGAGAISLCPPCWERIAKPAMYHGRRADTKPKMTVVRRMA